MIKKLGHGSLLAVFLQGSVKVLSPGDCLGHHNGSRTLLQRYNAETHTRLQNKYYMYPPTGSVVMLLGYLYGTSPLYGVSDPRELLRFYQTLEIY